MHSAAMSEWVDFEIVPGNLSAEDERNYWRGACASMWHPIGTCRMGAVTDPRSVVDPRLKVLHTKGLRVIDASVMPSTTSGNTQAPTLAIADRGADFILEEWDKE